MIRRALGLGLLGVLLSAGAAGGQSAEPVSSVILGLRLDARTDAGAGAGVSVDWLHRWSSGLISAGGSTSLGAGSRRAFARATGAWRPAPAWWVRAAVEGGPGRAERTFFYRRLGLGASYEAAPGRLILELAGFSFDAGTASALVAEPAVTVGGAGALIRGSYGRSLGGSYAIHYATLRAELPDARRRWFGVWTVGRSGSEVLEVASPDEADASFHEVAAGVSLPAGGLDLTLAANAAFYGSFTRFSALVQTRLPIP